jgi:hypothetical protein
VEPHDGSNHIGYTGWHDPPTNVMPDVVEREVPAMAAMGVAVEGSEKAWPLAGDNEAGSAIV